MMNLELLSGESFDLTDFFEGFGTMMNHSKDLFCVADLNTKTFLYVNDAFGDVLGYQKEDIIETSFLDMIHPDDVASTKEAIHKLKEQGMSVFHFENRYFAKNGSIKHLEWSSHPIKEKGLVYAVARDLTEHRRLMDELEDSKAKLQAIIDFSPTPLVVTNGVDTIEAVNKSFTRVLGYDLTEIETFDLWFKKAYPDKNYRDEVVALWQSVVSEAIEKDESFIEPTTVVCRTKDGSDLTVECSVGLVDGKVLVSITDITDHLNKEHELMRAKVSSEVANESKSKLLAVVNHELRTPLNAIIGPCELLREDIEDEEQREVLDIVFDSASYMLNLVNNILDLSKIESGQVEPVLQEVELEKFFNSVVSPLRSQAESKGLEFGICYKLSRGRFISDTQLLSQVIFNLVGNAIKFTRSGSVWVDLTQVDSDKLVIEVIDTGCGIHKEDVETIFKPFNQGNNISEISQKGSGLGLSITKELVELLGGTIAIDSKLGAGSRFTLTFPFEQ